MNRVKQVVERYPRWKEIGIYIERVELTIDTDFPSCIGHAKCLIESVGKEICRWQEKELPKNPNMNKVLRSAFQALGIPGSHYLVDMAKSLATIGQTIGELRNSIDISAHGKSLDELQRLQEDTQHYTAEFLIGSTDLVTSFLIETFERYRLEKDIEEEPEPIYIDFRDFNDAFDEENEEVFVAEYVYSPSEVLFFVDRNAFDTEYNRYLSAIDSVEEE